MSLEKYKQIISEDFSKEADLIDCVIKELGIEKSAKILDIGTGFGAMSILLALNGYAVITGQPEHDPEWEELTSHNEHGPAAQHQHEFVLSDWKENAKALGVLDKITFQFLNAEDLHFDAETFDAIFLYDALQHIKKRALVLNECLRLVKAKGVICVIEWNKESIRKDEKQYGLKIDYIDPNEIINRNDISIELISGNFVNIFEIKKQ